MDVLRPGFLKYPQKILWIICLLSLVNNTLAQTTNLLDDGTADTINFNANYHDLVIPASPSLPYIYLSARGGDGGSAKISERLGQVCKAKGGEGASVSAVFKIGEASTELKPGSTIRFITGGKGESDDDTAVFGSGFVRSGGGGGSAILYQEAGSTSWDILLVAGGGGGAYQGLFAFACVNQSHGQGGRTTEFGGRGGGGSSKGRGGRAGKGGKGGGPFADWSGGGGGAEQEGTGPVCAGGEEGGTTGNFGGCTYSSNRPTIFGGWGFGGGGSADESGGGGGGYSGGGGGGAGGRGGGGGSYLSSSAEFGQKVQGGTTSKPKDGITTYYFLDVPSTLKCKNAITVNITYNTGVTITPGDLDNGNTLGAGEYLTLSQNYFDDRHIGANTAYLMLIKDGTIRDFCSSTVQVRDQTPHLNDNGEVQTSEGAYTRSAPVYKIPATTAMNEVTFSSRGADGGYSWLRSKFGCKSCKANGGVGATINATFSLGNGENQLPKGTYIKFITGEKGQSFKDRTCTGIEGAGGGGGTAVLFRVPGDEEWEILLAAGGGGGAYQGKTLFGCINGNNGGGGRTQESGGDGNGFGGGKGGDNGEGGDGSEPGAGGGGAFTQGKKVDSPANDATGGQKGMQNGGNGGNGSGNAEKGGWGFGGGGSGWEAGGGGGGYSGGGAGGNYQSGKGGGSIVYSSAISSEKTPGGNTSNPQNGSTSYVFGLNCSSPPIAQCKEVTVQLNDTGFASITAEDLDAGSYDVCGVLTYSVSRSAFDCTYIGANSVTLTVSNATKSKTCIGTVVVEELTPPISVCQDITVTLDALSCEVTVPAGDLDGGSSDNCNMAGYSLIYEDCSGAACVEFTRVPSIILSGPGTQEVQLVVEDESGNGSICDATITVVDQVAPVAVCQDITVFLDAETCEVMVLASDLDGGSSDACGTPDFKLTYTECSSGICGEVSPISSTTFSGHGTQAVKLVVDDGNGNSSSCNATISLVDETTPTISCPSGFTLNNDLNNCGALFTNLSTPVFNDNCMASLSYTLSGDPIGDFSAYTDAGQGVLEEVFVKTGAAMVTYTATDDAGNFAACSFTLTVEDTEDPVLSCPADFTVSTSELSCTAGVSWLHAIASDNCPASLAGNPLPMYYSLNGATTSMSQAVNSQDGSTGANATLNLGVTTVSYDFADLAGNPGSCSFRVTVVDDVAPVAACKDLSIDFNGQEEISLDLGQVWDEAASFDNCGFVEFVSANLTIACEEVGNTVAIPVTIRDEADNVGECISFVEVIGLPCDWVEGPSDGSLNCDGQTTAGYDADEQSFTLTSDGCWQGNQDPDRATFVYQSLCGDGSLTAKLSSVNAGGYVGLMARETLDPLARRAGVLKSTSTRRVRREWRPIYDGPVVRTSSNRSGVEWLRIVRQGKEIKSYTSTNGSSWRLLYKVSFSNLEDCIYFGMMAYSLNGSAAVEGVFEQVTYSGSGAVASRILDDSTFITAEGLQAVETTGETGTGMISVFPNPASDRTQLVLEDFQDKPALLMVRDAFGKLVKQIDLDSAMGAVISLEVHDLTPGMYIISLVQDKQIKGSKRLIVQP